MQRPDPTEYAPAFGNYVALVPEEGVLDVLEKQLTDLLALLRGVPAEQEGVRHPPYTWSIREVVGHLTDTERVFGYRALRFARGDAAPLAGFDENDYARAAEHDRFPLRDLAAEFECVRRSHWWMFRHLPEAAWTRSGVANGNRATVRALAYVIAGHVRHHAAILRRRLSGV